MTERRQKTVVSLKISTAKVEKITAPVRKREMMLQKMKLMKY